MFHALIFILFMQVITCHIQSTVAKCTANIPNCSISGSTALYCTPIVSSVPHFLGMNISGCTVFGLQNEWTLSSIPKETFTRLRGVKAIKLNKGGLSFLPCDLFYHLKDDLRSVYLSYNHLETIQNCTFRNLQRLETLDLKKNRVSKLDDFLFYTLTSLQRIDMDYNMISELSSDVFRAVNGSKLEIINLSSNKISIIGEGVFTNLKLKILEMSNNGLKHIHKKSFLNSKETIRTLNLRYNLLTDDVWDALEGLNNLETIDLYNNSLTTIKPEVFNHLLKIQHIELSRNLIQEIKDVRLRSSNLHSISLSYNNVNYFDTDVFSSTETFSKSRGVTIDLSFNDLQMLHLHLPPCDGTCYIGLRNNRLKELTFSNSTRNQLNTIDVSNNDLFKLSDSFPHSKYYYLSNNPLSTETALRFLDRKLKDSYVVLMSNVSMFCSSPNVVFPEVKQAKYILNISNLSSLDLSRNCIKDDFVCSLIYNSSKQISVNLDRNYITSVPKCMVIVPNTISLSLQSNRISYVNFNNLNGKFSNLILGSNKITDLDGNITLVEKDSIKLRNNRLYNISEISLQFKNTSRITVDLSHNYIKKLDTLTFTFFENNYNFNLILSSNNLSTLPNIFIYEKGTENGFQNNYEYIFSNNALSSISTIYFTLDLVNHRASRLVINYKRNFIGLILSPVVFYCFKSTIGNINLHIYITYNFASNVFQSYPPCENLFQTNSAEVRIYSRNNIDLSHNKLTQIPNFDKRTSCYLLLRELNLGYNKIKKINQTFSSTNIKNPEIRTLILDYNYLEYIVPYAFNKLLNLHILNLSGNKLQIITAGIELMSLRYLYLSHNQITSVPSVMSKMKYLKELYLSYNKIVQFNAKITIPSYGYLVLTGNRLDCSCSNAWIRNSKNYINERCSTPSISKGYLFKCYPIGHCNKKYMIYPTWEVQSYCYNDKYIDMDIQHFQSQDNSDNNITVIWKTFGPFSPFGYFVLLKQNGTTVFTSELLEWYVISYIMKGKYHADQICVQALKKDIKPHFLKCIDVNKFNLSQRLLITEINQGSVTICNQGSVTTSNQGSATIIILAVLLSLSIFCSSFKIPNLYL